MDRETYFETVRAITQGNAVRDMCLGKNEEQAQKCKLVSVNIKQTSELDNASFWWCNQLHQVLTVAKRNGIVNEAIIHGSYGDFSNTPFSDLEITLVLTDDLLGSSEKCQELKHWLKKSLIPLMLIIDPLQHHGPFYIWSTLLDNYDEAILPTRVYKESWSVLAPIELKFSSSENSKEQSLSAFYRTINAIRQHDVKFFAKGINPFNVKRLLSNIMLLPAFFYQARGGMLSKREAILEILKLNLKPISRVLDISTDYREQWKCPPKWLGKLRGYVNHGQVPSGAIDFLILSMYRDAQLKGEVEKCLLPCIPEFCDEFERLVKSHETL